MVDNSFWLWFNLFILVMLALDLGVFNRRQHTIKFKESIAWVSFWVVLALLFGALVNHWYGSDKAFEYLTGYVIELSLSVDNLFVFIVIFKYFRVPPQYQHRVLFWGIVGALILRACFILAGVALFTKFEWIIYVFGSILLFTGVKMLFQKDEEDPKLEDNILVKLCRRFFPVTKEYDGKKFFTRKNNVLHLTPLFLVLVVVEFTDLVFAIDSIPAVLSITTDTFIVYTSNVFAILGLRSLYFALAGMMDLFRYLRYGLAVILSFVGIKMIISHYYHIPTEISLVIVLSVLATSILLSLYNREKKHIHSGAQED